MTISGIALFLLLAQNPAPPQPAVPAAPASIEGVVVKAVTGESLSKVTVTLSEVRSPNAANTDLQSFPISQNSRNMRSWWRHSIKETPARLRRDDHPMENSCLRM